MYSKWRSSPCRGENKKIFEQIWNQPRTTSSKHRVITTMKTIPTFTSPTPTQTNSPSIVGLTELELSNFSKLASNCFGISVTSLKELLLPLGGSTVREVGPAMSSSRLVGGASGAWDGFGLLGDGFGRTCSWSTWKLAVGSWKFHFFCLEQSL